MMKNILLSTIAVFAMSSFAVAGGDIEPVVQDAEIVEDSTLYNVALKAGTLGLGLDASYMYTESIGFRFNVNGLSYNDTRDVSDIDYDADLNLLTVGLLVDYYPFDNNFRMSAGVYYNDNKADGVFRPTSGQTVEIGDKVYDASQIGKVEAGAYYDDNVAPYIGIGWGNKSTEGGWGFTLDVGALYQGPTQVYANAKVLDPLIKDEVAKELEIERKQIEDDIKDYEWYPVIMIGVNYTF